ncbi:T. brucei spp-specific protein, (fragment), partial [Trypanosoma brucei gambiense DAL972]
LVEQMNNTVGEIALNLLRSDRDYLHLAPEGVPIEVLPLEVDAKFCALEAERAMLKGENNPKNASMILSLEEKLNERARQLAQEQLLEDLKELSSFQHCVPLSLLSPHTDVQFAADVAEFRRLKKEGEQNTPAIQGVVGRLNARANELAEEYLRTDRASYLNPEQLGVPLDLLSLDTDSEFVSLEAERLKLLLDRDGYVSYINVLETRLNDRVRELCRLSLLDFPEFLLDVSNFGVPLEELCLFEDDGYRRHICSWYKLRRTPEVDNERNSCEACIVEIVREKAKLYTEEILRSLPLVYRGIPLRDADLFRNDGFINSVKRFRRAVREKRDESEIVEAKDNMKNIAFDIIDGLILKERGALDQEPEGISINNVPLDYDNAYLEMEAELHSLLKQQSMCDAASILQLRKAMNDRVHHLALIELAKMRTFLDPEIFGIPIKDLRLEGDVDFRNAEISRYKKLKNEANADVKDLEVLMTARALEVARAFVARERAFLEPEPHGLLLEELLLDTHKVFTDLERERRVLLKEPGLCENTVKIKSLQDKMRAVVNELAVAYVAESRKFLDPAPEGVPLEELSLDSNELFIELEKRRFGLLREGKGDEGDLKDVEKSMQDCIRELAKGLLKENRAYLNQKPLGIPLDYLPLNNDKKLRELERKRRELLNTYDNDSPQVKSIEGMIIKRIDKIAARYLEGERSFLVPCPQTVPLRYLPLNADTNFCSLEQRRRELRRGGDTAEDDAMIKELEIRINDRAHELAKEVLHNGRLFLHPEILGVAVSDIPLSDHEPFVQLEEALRRIKVDNPINSFMEADLREKLKQCARQVTEKMLDEERSFLDQNPLGIPLNSLMLNYDPKMQELERVRRKKLRDKVDANEEEREMVRRVNEMAEEELRRQRMYLPATPLGIPFQYLGLDSDGKFDQMENFLRTLKRDPLSKEKAIRDQENANRQYVFKTAAEYKRRERAYLNPEPNGVSLKRLSLDTDPKFQKLEQMRRMLMHSSDSNDAQIGHLEHLANEYVLQLALQQLGWQDAEFHDRNRHLADDWVRISELYPEGKYVPFEPTKANGCSVVSAPNDASYLAPFIAALSRCPDMLRQLCDTTSHPVNGPYSFIFFDPNSNPVRVDIDDRVPVDAKCEPKFTRVPHRSWYPLLLEKAYAKFVGGYAKLDQCTPHETLRDLTGRPVLHIPFDDRLADAANTGDFRSVKFWKGIKRNLAAGDVITCISNHESVDGLHSQCSYALLSVIETVHESNDVSDIVIKLHNCYYDSPTYDGPLCNDDDNWTDGLKRLCHYNPEEDALYIPVPVFLRNFSSMQRCHINCGDRLTAPGEWTGVSCGGNPKFTTFRNNPIYLVENKTSRPVTILAELRHHAPAYRDPDDVNHYHQSGLALLKAINTRMPVSPILTSVTHRFLHRGMMLDAREVCAQMELPPSTTCYLVPYTLGRDNYGKFHISVYPGLAKVNLAPLRTAALFASPVVISMSLKTELRNGVKVEFVVSRACDAHVLLCQRRPKVIDVCKSDLLGDFSVNMAVYDENG